MNSQRVFALLLLIVGGILLANNLLELNISLFKILLSFGLLFLGAMLITGRGLPGPGGPMQNTQNVVFGSAHNRVSDNEAPESFTTLFGEQTINLERLSSGGKNLYISSTFSEVKLLMPRDMPVRITANALFGEAKLPNGDKATFGEKEFSDLKGLNEPAVDIRVQVIFGSFKIKWI
jgi:hypothetical protein